jgi:hypothetical protein
MMCHLSDEGLAWEIGLDLAYVDGYKWDHDSKQQEYARDRLSTYIRSGIWGEMEPIEWKKTPTILTAAKKDDCHGCTHLWWNGFGVPYCALKYGDSPIHLRGCEQYTPEKVETTATNDRR